MKLLMTVIHGDQVQQQHSFDACSVMVGRNAPCNVLLGDPGVSRVHAELSLEGGTWYLNDLGSANGTLLNGVRQERAPLKSGDVVTIASYQLHVTISSPSRNTPVNPAAAGSDRTIRASSSDKRA